MKKSLLLSLPLLTTAALGAAPVTALAQACPAGKYDLIVPIGSLSGCVTLTQYLNGVVLTVIGIAGVLAVIMLVICGIKVMASSSSSGKSEAKECLWNAVFGILLALGAWIILNTINPALLNNSADLMPISVVSSSAPPQPGTGGTAVLTEPMPTAPGWYFRYKDKNGNTRNSVSFGDFSDACRLSKESKAKEDGITIANGPNGTPECFQITEQPGPGDELATRRAICGNDSCFCRNLMPGVCKNSNTNAFVNNPYCIPITKNGVTGNCTNVRTLPGDVIGAITALAGACNCIVIVSGGTEVGHQSHGENKPIFDIWRSKPLDDFILLKSSAKNVPSFNGNRRWLYNNFWYTMEGGQMGNHWHVCRNGFDTSQGCTSKYSDNDTQPLPNICGGQPANLCEPLQRSCTNGNCAQFSAMAAKWASGAASAALIKAIIVQESSCGLPQNMRSQAGACGPTQFLPSTAAKYAGACGVTEQITCDWLADKANWDKDICLTAAYLKALAQTACGNDVRNIAAGYNSGAGRCQPSANCSDMKSCDGGTMKQWECPYDNNAHTMCNTGLNETKKYATQVLYCTNNPGY